MSIDSQRRKLLKITATLMPIAFFTRQAKASTNAELRSQFKYKNTPEDGKNCSTCLEFIPGKSEADLGGCKRIPGDDEIAPDGYCILWNTL